MVSLLYLLELFFQRFSNAHRIPLTSDPPLRRAPSASSKFRELPQCSAFLHTLAARRMTLKYTHVLDYRFRSDAPSFHIDRSLERVFTVFFKTPCRIPDPLMPKTSFLPHRLSDLPFLNAHGFKVSARTPSHSGATRFPTPVPQPPLRRSARRCMFP